MDIFFAKCDKNQSLHEIGRKIVFYVAKEIYDIKNYELEIVNKKPKFKYSDICFSISHSKEYVAVCFNKYPLGFDLEKIQNRNYHAISKRMKFNCKKNTIEEFYENWTLFEAEYKLQKKAIYTYMNNFGNDYIFSIASEFEIKNIKYYDLTNILFR